jgi:hypothetical protein
LRSRRQPGADRILQNVLHLLAQAFITAQNVIEGFILPNPAHSSQSLVDAVSRLALYGARDLWDRN